MEVKIFICFAVEDEKLYKGLERHLIAAGRHRGIEWHSNESSAGTDWRAENEKHLKTAQIILLLVSPAFMASDYCYLIQTTQAMERHKRGEAIVIPVILRFTADWQDAPFGKLKALPTNTTPVTSRQWHTQDEAFFDVAKGFIEAIKVSGVKFNEVKERRGFSRHQNPGSSHFKRPLGMQLCPFCIEEFYPGQCDIFSVRDGKIIESGKTGWLERRMPPNSLTTPEYRALQACRQCPYCKHLLPYNIEQVDENISIAVIGDTWSGKSFYLASLLYHMQERWAKNSAFLQISPLDQRIEDRYAKDYFNPLIKRREGLAATSPALNPYVDPLVYTMILHSSHNKQEKNINLIFYDGAGEDYAFQRRMEHVARYVLRASAVIFVVDPWTIPEIYNGLTEHLTPPNYLTGIVPYYFLTSVIDLFEKYSPLAFRSVPLAIMLSKSDLLKHIYSPIVPPLRYLSDSPHHYLDLQDIKTADSEVRALISETSERPLLEVAQRFSKVGFFASSSTGCSADHNGNFPHVSPYRCLDPFLWILHELKIIPGGRNL